MLWIGQVHKWLEWDFSKIHHLFQLPAPSSDLWVSAMLDDRKLSARALFDDSSHRQTQLAVQVHTGQTVCHKLPFHVYVSVGAHINHKFDIETSFTLACMQQSDTLFVSVFSRRTQQTTSVQLASHCDLKSTTQKAVQCWMKAGQQLSRNLWVAQHWLFSLVTFLLHFLPLFFPSNMPSYPCVPLQIQFFKDCGEDDVCTTDLVLQAHMDISGTKYIF